MQQINTRTLDEPPTLIKNYRCEPDALLLSAPLADDVPTPRDTLSALLSRRSQSSRRAFTALLTYDSDYAATRVAIAEAARRQDAAYHSLKRLIDILIAGTLLIALLPLYLLIALAIRIGSPGPVFYYQHRVGRNGVPFRFYKFRSMVWNADALKAHLAEKNEATGPIFKMRNDPRVTHFGSFLRRTSLDELPQLINVIRGDVTLVGPRPLVVPEAYVCDPRQHVRHSVPPGLLCLREISGRSALSFTEWMELDLLYVANRSFLTDVRILLIAIPVVLAGKGAY